MIEDLRAHPLLPLLWIAPVLYWLVLGWILWKFYRALDRIGGELGEIKAILRDRNDATNAPSR
jgi:hypothetical protein